MQADHSHETRAIYHAQHSRIAADEQAMTRFINMFSYEYFGLPDGWFRDKAVLDAGCGSTAKILIALYRLGARTIRGFDLDTDFIPTASASLKRYGVPENVVKLDSASVLQIPYEDNSYDFVCCHGVLVHLNNTDESARGFSELARVTKSGGYLYTVYGCVGGLLEDAIFPALRQYYRTNAAFKAFIDRLGPDDLKNLVSSIESGILKFEGSPVDLKALKGLLDTDLCVTVQNVLQAPVRLQLTENMVRDFYLKAGFEQPRRLRRYVKRQNIRRYTAPLHYTVPDDPTLQLIYGSGNLEFIGRKL